MLEHQRQISFNINSDVSGMSQRICSCVNATLPNTNTHTSTDDCNEQRNSSQAEVSRLRYSRIAFRFKFYAVNPFAKRVGFAIAMMVRLSLKPQIVRRRV